MSASRKLHRRQRQRAELTERQRQQLERTQRGDCSRCGHPMHRHTRFPELRCPDGGGSFTWALDAAGRRQAIERIEAMRREIDRARRPLSADAQAVIDQLVELSGANIASAISMSIGGDGAWNPGRNVTARELAAALGWTVDRVKLAIVELREQGCVDGTPANPS